MLKAPFQLLAKPVRAVETMTASVMGLILKWPLKVLLCGAARSSSRAVDSAMQN
jgi:hypothetical protein